MKNFYLLLLVIMAAIGFSPTASAQEEKPPIQFYVHGQPVKNGDRIDMASYFNSGKKLYEPELTCVATAADDLFVTVDFYKNETTPLDENWEYGADVTAQFCWPNSCVLIDPGISKDFTGELVPDVATDMQLHVGFDMGDEQTYEDLYVNFELSVTAKFQGEETVIVFYAKTNEPEVIYSSLSEEEGTCKLVSYTGINKEAIIPEIVSINGKNYTVIEIGDDGFNSNTHLESVTLPTSITKIGNRAFSGCSSLSSINFPENLEVIEDNAFKSCGNLVSVTLPSSITKIGNGAFSGCRSISSINFPENLDVIEDNVFKSCGNLVSVTLPTSITKIGNGAFSGCSSLSSINFPENITTIGDEAFKSCGNLTILQLPYGLNYIGNEAFYSALRCESLTLPGTVKYVGKECYKDCSINYIEFQDGELPIKIHNDAFDNISDLRLQYLGRNIIWEGGQVMPFTCGETLTLGEALTDMSWFRPVEVQNLSQIISNTMTPPSIDRFTQQQYDYLYVYVPASAKEDYENHQEWAFFKKLVGLELPYTAYEIALNADTMTINVGEVAKIDYSINPSVDAEVVMQVDNYDVLSYYELGKIVGREKGEATVTFTLLLNGKTAKCKVNVIQPATTIELNKTNLIMQKGETAKILANVGPYDAYDLSVAWSSTDEKVATVTDGLVTAIGGGECDIIATTHNGIEARCHVTVPVSPESISFDITEVTLRLDESFDLTVEFSPSDVTEKGITWESLNSSVAIVNEGSVYAVGIGETIIKATTSNGLSADCRVTVIPIYVESIEVLPPYVESIEGGNVQLSVVVLPENATYKTVVWSVADSEIATVDQNGYLSIIGDGMTTVYATATDGSGIVGKCEVTGVSGLDSIFANGEKWDLYNYKGMLIKRNVSEEELNNLTPSLYILKNRKRSVKFIKR